MKELLTLVGTRFLGPDAVKVVKAMKTGDVVQLVRDPQNAHDSNAVKVLAAGPRLHGAHIGFIKATEAARLSQRMDRKSWATVWGNVTFAGSDQPMIEIEGDG